MLRSQQLQQERHVKVVELLQLATSERDTTQRVKLLLKSQELLLKADTFPETVATCLDFFLNLQADTAAPVRRFAAYFLQHLLLFKPSLSLRCSIAITSLLGDSDNLVKDLALKAAALHHGRALLAISKEQDASESQHLSEQLRRLQEKARILLYCDDPVLLAAAARWAQVVILSQTPAPLLLRARVPAELRGVSCVQDLPLHRGSATAFTFDSSALQQQAEQLFELLLQLLQQSISGYNDGGNKHRAKAPFLIGVIGSVGRQRPAMLPAALDIFKKILEQPKQILGEQSFEEVRKLVCDEIQLLLASGLTAEWHPELMELLVVALPRKGSLEDLATQSKYKQICNAADHEGDGLMARPKKRARKGDPKHVWTQGEGLSTEEVTYDADAILSGEAEEISRRFEEYFGLPSQREPAGHVPGPALLATRINSQAELARIALTSLSSLPLQRSLHRDKAHEHAVAFSDFVESSNGQEALEALQEQVAFLTKLGHESDKKEKSDKIETIVEDARDARDPRAQLESAGLLGVQGDPDKEEIVDEADLLAPDASKLHLPQDQAKDALQLRLFGEVLESHRRMESSLMKQSLLPSQLASYEQMSRQVSLHLAAGYRTAAHPDLQRSMCQAYVLRTFDTFQASLQAGNKGTALDQLVELFYAKFATDVARWQESPGAVPLREILEASSSRRLAAANFTYAELFDMCLAEFEKRDVPRRELRSFLGELPAIPSSAFRALEAQCQVASARKMALLTILALIEGKPACRWRGLRLLFKLAFSAEEEKDDVRFDTIRLIVNKIYAPTSPMRWQLPHLSDGEVRTLIDAEDKNGSGWELPDPDFLPLHRLRGRCVEDMATLMLRSAAAPDAHFRHKIGIPQRLEQLRAELFKGPICSAKNRVWPYFALCIKRPILLHGLVEVFIQCDAEMKEHLINSIEEAIKHIPVTEQELLVLVQKASRATEPLVLKVLNILMTSRKREPLHPSFGEAVIRLYKETDNPRLLVPVFDLLDRNSLLDYLPAVLQLEADRVADAFRLIVGSRAPPLSVTELLMELHHVNSPGENIVPIKASMQALNIIFGMRDQFDTKVYGIVIQSLVEEPGPLPTLFMRTVIQVVKELPRLSDFIVMEILPRLVRQEVWGDEQMWKGFMIVLQHTFASQPTGAARVLAMLPVSQLEDVLVQHPDWKAQLRDYVSRQPPGTIMPHVKQLLE